MKRRTKVVALATSLLVGVSMIGVGFATWVIASEKTATSTGNVTAETVNSDYVRLSVTGSDQNFHFGPENTSNPNEGGKWLQYAAGTQAASLNVSFTLTVLGSNAGDIQLTLSMQNGGQGSANQESFWQAVTNNYITAPTVSISASGDSESTYSVTSGVFSSETAATTGVTLTRGEKPIPANGATITVTVAIGWGSAFNSQNPYAYYNAMEASAANIQGASTALTQLYNDVNSLTYTLTFTAQDLSD